jgi:hypothetical protein
MTSYFSLPTPQSIETIDVFYIKRNTEHKWHARIVENTFAKITVHLRATIAKKVQMKVVIWTRTKSQVRLINPIFFKK